MPDSRKRRIVRITLLLATVLVALGVGVSRLRDALASESTDDAFVEGHLAYLSARVPGQVVEVLVQENQEVRAGQVLVRLDRADYEARLARARADLDAARNRVSQALAASASAGAQARASSARLAHAEQELTRARELFAHGAGSRMSLDAAVAARDAAAAEVRAAEQRAEAERAVVGNEAPVRQAEAAVKEAELALEWTTLVAPFDGRIGKKNVELGVTVSPGQPLLSLVATHGSWVVANFKETQIGSMKLGDPVEIEVDAFPGRVWRGHVASISPATGAKYALLPPDNATGNFTKVVQRLPVRIELDSVEGESVAPGEDPTSLPVGLSVVARVRGS